MYDELKPGIYEFVLTNFHGGALVRYRIGDLFEVISLQDEELGSPLPQLRFYSRADDVVDLGNLVRLTEKDVWRAIEATQVEYQDWTVRKEFNDEDVILHVYVEPKPSMTITRDVLQKKLALELSRVSAEFNSLEEILGYNPVRVSLLKSGSFDYYMKRKQQEGADLAHLKPPHMQPSDLVLQHLFEHGGSMSGTP